MVQQCTTLVVTVAQGALDAGVQTVALQNPDPAGCTATRADALTVPPVLAITEVQPGSVCVGAADAALPLTLVGTGFLDVDGALPTFSFGGTTSARDARRLHRSRRSTARPTSPRATA